MRFMLSDVIHDRMGNVICPPNRQSNFDIRSVGGHGVGYKLHRRDGFDVGFAVGK